MVGTYYAIFIYLYEIMQPLSDDALFHKLGALQMYALQVPEFKVQHAGN